jgi:hypothetical protein
MKPLSPVEKTFLSFSLCVVAGMALVQCTPALSISIQKLPANSVQY